MARFTLCLSFLSFALVGCGGGTGTLSTPPSLLTSTMTLGGAGTIGQSEIFPTKDGPPYPYNGQVIAPAKWACVLHASSAPMSFIAASSSTWFTVVPAFGTIPANGRSEERRVGKECR